MASVYTVTKISAYIKNVFAQDFALSRISVKGEVSNCKYHSSGHIYFTLKDQRAAIGCVMFAGQRKGLEFKLEEGQSVVVTGSIEVYERDGRYQLYAREITREGMGDLFERFIKLRDELEEMGMFSPEYKRPIPRYAGKVGIVTASTGAAVRDIMNISARRNPYVQLYLYPALVQGDQARFSIAKGIETLDAMGLDVIIVGRGGGSIEDLWAFNEEIVARAIFACQTPVISAVGHETDVTIADYVADMRAPTPSAAAELAVFDYGQFEDSVALYREALKKAAARKLERYRYQTEQRRLRVKLFDPRRGVREERQRAVDIEEKLKRIMTALAALNRSRAKTAEERLSQLIKNQIVRDRRRLELIVSRLDGLSPLKRLGGGYAYVTDGKGKRLYSVTQVKEGDALEVSLTDGRLKAVVSGITKRRITAGKNGRQEVE